MVGITCQDKHRRGQFRVEVKRLLVMFNEFTHGLATRDVHQLYRCGGDGQGWGEGRELGSGRLEVVVGATTEEEASRGGIK